MQFRDVQQNYPVFILDKQALTVKQGKVMSKGFPYPDRNNLVQANLGPTKMMVDIGIEVDGKTAVYAIPDELSVTYAGNLIISVDKAGIVNEIEAIRNTAEQVINSIDAQKERFNKASGLLSELNPEYKAKRETEDRLNKLEGSLDDLKAMMSKLVNALGDK